MSKPKFFLAETNGYLICVDRADLLVADSTNVRVNDSVQFKYGVETFSGAITYMSASEDETLAEMKLQSNQKRPKPQASAGVPSKRVRHPVGRDSDVSSNVKESSSKSKSKNAAKMDAKRKKDKAEAVIDDNLAGLPAINSKKDVDPESDNSNDSELSGISSSIDDSSYAKKRGRIHDVRKLNAICSDSDSDVASSTDGRAHDKNNNANKEESQVKNKVINEPCGSAIKEKLDHCVSRRLAKVGNPEVDKGEEVCQEVDTGLQNSKNDKKMEKRRVKDGEETESSENMKGMKGQCKLKRNLKIYTGPNGCYLYSQDTCNAVKIHPSYDVYTLKNILDKALHSSRTASVFCRVMLENVYTEDALQNASAFGYPPRGKIGNMSQSQVMPRLDPKGIDAIVDRALEHQITYKTWRPKASEGQLRSSITNKVCLAKKAHTSLKQSESSDSIESDQ